MNIEQIKELREATGAGILDCKNALDKSDGSMSKARTILRMQGYDIYDIRSARVTPQGLISSYIHHNRKVGAMVEIRCETDFASTMIREFAKDICMQIAATNPEFLRKEDVPEERIHREKQLFLAGLKDSNKPEEAWSKIVAGKMKKFYLECCLLEQKSVKDSTVTVGELLAQKSRQTGEKIVIANFCRFHVN